MSETSSQVNLQLSKPHQLPSFSHSNFDVSSLWGPISRGEETVTILRYCFDITYEIREDDIFREGCFLWPLSSEALRSARFLGKDHLPPPEARAGHQCCAGFLVGCFRAQIPKGCEGEKRNCFIAFCQRWGKKHAHVSMYPCTFMPTAASRKRLKQLSCSRRSHFTLSSYCPDECKINCRWYILRSMDKSQQSLKLILASGTD